MKRRIPQRWLEWGFLGLLAGLCATLSVLQFRWTGDVSQAERGRLRASLDQQLEQLAAAFHRQLNFACNGLLPTESEFHPDQREVAFAERYRRWSANSPPDLFSRILLAVAEKDGLTLLEFDPLSMRLKPAAWPEAWKPLAEQFSQRLAARPPTTGEPPPASTPGPTRRRGPLWLDVGPNVIEMPVFGSDGRERGWIVLELNLEFVRSQWMPDLVQRYLNPGTEPHYDVEVFVRELPRGENVQPESPASIQPASLQPQPLIYTTLPSGERMGARADATIHIFSPVFLRPGPWTSEPAKKRGPAPSQSRDFPGRWTVAARHRAGSLEAVVARTRAKNLVVSLSLLCLILVAGFALIRSTRQSRRLAEMQLNFVAGISHELRTPLTVIRGAGHNLLNGLIREPKQLQKYGALIVEHAEMLTGIVEQVLAFASVRKRSGPVEAQPVWLDKLLSEALSSASAEISAAHCRVDLKIPDNLPPVLGDQVALRRAMQNLISNAARHGGSGGWIGVSAELKNGSTPPVVELRVSDCGPGIPEDELNQIFEPFYRGRNARADHVRGTGLGLSLIREIVEAHKGTVSARNRAEGGAEFILHLPAASPEQYDEFAHSAR